MNGNIYSKLEIDVMQIGELKEAVDLASKYNLPSIVVHPNLATDAHIARGMAKATNRLKLIIPVDWPKGEVFGSLKMRGLSIDALEADGFELMLTGNKSANDTKNEAKALTDFIRQHLPRHVEIRFVLGTQSRDIDNIAALCEGLVGLPTPAMVRLDMNLKAQIGKANPEVHNKMMETIRAIAKFPLKISGNLTGIRTITACQTANRFAVSLTQAKTIIKELQHQPEQLQKLLDTAESDKVENEQQLPVV